MSELPNGWIEVTVGDVATSALGKMLDKAKQATGKMYPYLRNQNVRWDAVDLTDVYEMPFDDDELERFGLHEGDLLICEGGEPGRAAVWDGSAVGMKFQKAIHRLRPTEALQSRWLLHRLRADANSGGLAAYFTGTTIKHFTGVSLERYRLPLPPLNEQRRIVEKLDAIFEKSRAAKARLERLPALLEKLKRSILAAAFRGDLTKDWRAAHPNVEPASVLLERIRTERRRRWEEGLRAKGKDPKKATYEEPEPVDVEGLPELPEGWRLVRLLDLVDVSRGITYGIVQTGVAVDDGIPTVRCGDIKGEVIDVGALKLVSRTIEAAYPRTRLVGGEVLIAIRGTTGGVAIAPLELRGGNISREVAMVPTLDLVNARFVLLFLSSPSAQQAILGKVKGVAQQGINLDDLRDVVVPVPPAEEQAALLTLLEAVLGGLAVLGMRVGEKTERIATLEQAALAKAFRGELVPQDVTDEPASVLLDRIRAARSEEPREARRRPSPPNPLSQRERGNSAAPEAGERDRLPSPSGRGAGGEGSPAPLDLVVAAFQQAPRLTATSIGATTGLDAASVKKVLKALVDGGQVRVEGKGRSTTYRWSS